MHTIYTRIFPCFGFLPAAFVICRWFMTALVGVRGVCAQTAGFCDSVHAFSDTFLKFYDV